MKRLLFQCALGVLSVMSGLAEDFRETTSLDAPEAVQAAAADDRFVYAVDSTKVAKYDRVTGNRVAVSKGDAFHLNSAFLYQGGLYCAHSNYPKKPEHSEIKVLDLGTMELTTFKDFGESNGSLTWAIHDGAAWWCTFAFYGQDNARTRFVKFNEQWREVSEWTYPPEVVKELGKYSISGGIWRNRDLLVTGHDRRVLYRLRLPETGKVLKYIESIAVPFTGQGIGADPKTGGLVGIDRAKKRLIVATAAK